MEEILKQILDKLDKNEIFQNKALERLESIESEVFKISASQQEDIKAMLEIINGKTTDIQEEMQGMKDIIGQYNVDIAVLKRKTKSFKIAE